MNLKKLSDNNLHEQTKVAAKTEKSATLDLLKHLEEINRRVLYAEFGYSTLQKYVMKELGYSEGESWVRIQACKLIHSSPSAAEKIADGTLSLSNAATLQSHLQDFKLQTPEKIAEIINLGVDKSHRELKKELDEKAGRQIVEKKITLRKNILEKIKRLNKLLESEMSELEIFESLLDEKIRRQELQSSRTCEKNCVISGMGPARAKHTRYIPVQVKRQVVAGANHQCEFKNQQGKRCQERRNLQFDHVKPFALGGDRSAQNIQMLCFGHNQRRAKLTFS